MLCLVSAAMSGALLLAPPPAAPASVVRTLAPSMIANLLVAPDRHVRTTNARIQSLLEKGLRRSPTLAQLVLALNDTDVIVYLEPVAHLQSGLAGRIFLLPVATGNQRYLRVQLRVSLTAEETIATIGHELQHAVEIAAERDVRDDASLVSLYHRIGVEGSSDATAATYSFDTEAAQRAGRQVRLELAS
jgi:hypothetical protein